MGSDDVDKAYLHQGMLDYTYYYDEFIRNGYPTLIYTGEFDQRDGSNNQMIQFRNMKSLDPEFFTSATKIYYVPNGDGTFQTGGTYRTSTKSKFTFLVLPKAGHFVPTNILGISKQFV